MMAVDAFVESSVDGGQTWGREGDPRATPRTKGPWLVPHALEIARACWCTLVPSKRWMVRVVDTDGVVVEQWPK